MTRDEIIEGLRQGRTLTIDRRDSPILPIAMALVDEGLADRKFTQHEEQSSSLSFKATESLLAGSPTTRQERESGR